MDRILTALKDEITRQQANVFAIAAASHDSFKALQLQMVNPCQNVYSVAKVYVVTAIGMLVDRGLLSTDEFMTDILRQECPADYPSIWNQVTVEMLLCHRVPLPRHFLDIDVCNAVTFGADYLTYILHADGTLENCSLEACYTDAAYYLLSRIVE